MTTLETVEFVLPAFWASALINGDYSGLEGADETALNKWLAGNPNLDCVDCTDEPNFMRYHDAAEFVLACDCLTYTFFVTGD